MSMATGETPWPGVTALLVEDHPALRRILSQTLATLGFEVIALPDADAARTQIERHGCPALLFSDVRMPGSMTGIDLARWVRERHPDARILLQTGYAVGDATGFVTITKPFSADQLLEAIQATGLPMGRSPG
ncbi:MAG: response regulator [Steroidobacteraceae bacterium]